MKSLQVSKVHAIKQMKEQLMIETWSLKTFKVRLEPDLTVCASLFIAEELG